MKILRLIFFTTLMFKTVLSYSQIETKPEIMIGIGGSVNLINQLDVAFQGGAYGVNAGFFTNKSFYKNFSVFFGFNYSYHWMDNYRNTVFDYDFQINANLTSSISQQAFEVPTILKYNSGKFALGGGVILSFLIASKINQSALGNYDSTWLTNVIHTSYRIEGNKDISPFSTVNVAPAIFIEYRLNKKNSILYLCSYDILTNPVIKYKFAEYNTLNNNLILTYKF